MDKTTSAVSNFKTETKLVTRNKNSHIEIEEENTKKILEVIDEDFEKRK